MNIHDSIPHTIPHTIPPNLTEEFISYEIFLPSNLQKDNTLTNLDTAIGKIKQLNKSGQSTIIHDPRTGDLVITCTIGNSKCILRTSTNENTSHIKIEYYCCEKRIHYEVQRFNSKKLSGHLRFFLLTPEDLEQLRAFEHQEQERKDALENAHDSNPQTCDPNTCVHCANERQHNWCKPCPLGSYT